MTTERKKVQVSIPKDQYDEIEKRWKAYGFSSVAEAARVLLMGDLNEHVKEMRRQVSAMEKMEELQAKKVKSKQHAKTKPERPKTTEKAVKSDTGENLPRSNPKIEKILKQWLDKGVIDKAKYDKAKGIRQWQDADGKKRVRVWLHGG